MASNASWDPDSSEILAFLVGAGFGPGGPWDADDFDRAESTYWFAYACHGGQWSALYGVLSTSPYRPGPLTNGPESGSVAESAYDALIAEWEDHNGKA